VQYDLSSISFERTPNCAFLGFIIRPGGHYKSMKVLGNTYYSHNDVAAPKDPIVNWCRPDFPSK